MGPDEGTEVIYNWMWYYNLPNLLLWLVLIAALIFVRGNHNPQVLLILIPLIIVNLLWIIFKKVMAMPSTESNQFGMVFHSFTVGVAVLWLLGHKLGNLNRIVVFFAALAIMMVIGLLSIISYGSMDFSDETIAVLALQSILTLAMLLSFVLTRWRCRKRYSNVKFMLYLGLWSIISCLINVIVVFFIVSGFQGSAVSLGIAIPMLLIVGLVIGVFVYMAVFPFMILAFRNPFYRERFCLLLRIKSVSAGENSNHIDADTRRDAAGQASD